MVPDSTVREFYESYRSAFEALDPVAIGEFFAFPCQITGDTGGITVQSIPSREQWTPVLEGLVGAYQTIGVKTAEMLDLQVFVLTDRLAQASVRWRLMNGHGQALYDFEASYTLADLGAGLRITAIVHNEGPRLAEKLASAGR